METREKVMIGALLFGALCIGLGFGIRAGLRARPCEKDGSSDEALGLTVPDDASSLEEESTR